MKEIFKDIKDYEGLYQISNLGNVKSLKRKGRKEDKILKSVINSNGYRMIYLQKDKKSKTKSIHQLLAVAFLNHKPNGRKTVVDHIDNNPLNNKLENLQLISFRENLSKDKINCSSDYTGVSWDKPRNLWRSSITLNSKWIQLGRFDTEEEAHNEYQKALNNHLKNNL